MKPSLYKEFDYREKQLNYNSSKKVLLAYHYRLDFLYILIRSLKYELRFAAAFTLRIIFHSEEKCRIAKKKYLNMNEIFSIFERFSFLTTPTLLSYCTGWRRTININHITIHSEKYSDFFQLYSGFQWKFYKEICCLKNWTKVTFNE